MSIIYDIRQWNFHICFFLAIVLNFSLIWLIIKKSPKEMRFYSRILLQTAIVDILLVTSSELLHNNFFMFRSRMIFYLDGILAKAFPYTMAQFILYSLWLCILNMSIFGQIVQFFYRYLLLVKDTKISLACYCSMLLIIVLITSFIWLVFALIAGYPIGDDEQFVEEQQLAQLISVSSDNHLILAMNVDTTQPIISILNYSYTAQNIICYAIIIFCAAKMIRFVRKNTVKSTQKQLDKQLTRTLIALAIVLFLWMCCNIAIASSFFLFQKILLLPNDNKQSEFLVVSVQLLFAIPTIWITVLNPLIVMITIKSYRRTMVDFLIRARARVTPQ